MAKIHLVLKKKDNQYYFSNPKRGSENELFNCKIDGTKIICELLSNEIISETDAIELLTTLLNVWDIPYGKPDALAQFESDAAAIHAIDKFRDGLQMVNVIQKIPDLPVFQVCQGCGEHGRVLARTFMSIEFHSKNVAFEAVSEMIGKGDITRAEEVKLRQQITESALPATDPNENSHLN